MIYKKIVRPLLFQFPDPETVHDLALKLLAHTPLASLLALGRRTPGKPIGLWGLRFPNRLGLAAGIDKDALAMEAWEKLGFGFVEVGGFTPRPQQGNSRPRIFRCVKEQAIINRMGFPNPGMEVAAERLRQYKEMRSLEKRPSFPIGVGIVRNRSTPLESMPNDYIQAFQKLYSYGDFFVVNVSSPNTPGLRTLQQPKYLDIILHCLQQINSQNKPLLVKIAPDLNFQELEKMLEVMIACQIHGVVATNTTLDHSAVKLQETGGLSGRPLTKKSNEIIRFIHRQTDGKLPIIGVGGVFTRDDYLEKLDAGASLVQLYTGFIYEGPYIAHRILRG